MRLGLTGLLLVLPLLLPAGACAWPADEDARVEADVAAIRRGIGDLFQAARAGHPTLLQDAEREILAGLLDGLEASMAGGKLDAARYNRVLEGYDEASHLFKELPYNLEVSPGEGLRPISLPLRRHPWWTLSERPLQGWRAERVASGASLKPAE